MCGGPGLEFEGAVKVQAGFAGDLHAIAADGALQRSTAGTELLRAECVLTQTPRPIGSQGAVYRAGGGVFIDAFYIHDDLLYTDDYRLCIPTSYRKEVFDQVHDRINYIGLAKIVELLAPIVCIYRLSRYVRDYIRHYPKYNVFQTKRHKP